MKTRKMYEMIKNYEKDYIHNQYARIVEKFKNYDKISVKKMLDEIYEVYSDYKNIINICTVRELKYLEMILDNNIDNEKLIDDKYLWEKNNLEEKFLIQYNCIEDDLFIPDEIIDKVKLAIENVNYDEAIKLDKLNEILVSICKVMGNFDVLNLCRIGCGITHINEKDIYNHIIHNKVFNYYVIVMNEYNEKLERDFLIALHQDYYQIKDKIDEERMNQGLAGTLKIDVEQFKTLFYNDFNINNPKIKKFIEQFDEYPFEWMIIKDIIRDFSVLNFNRKELKEIITNLFKDQNIDLKQLFKLMDQAMDEMPSAVLNGLTPNEAKKHHAEIKKIESNKVKNYVSQKNACLSEKDAKLFYKIYFGLLDFTNTKYNIKPNLKIYNKLGINPYEIREIVECFWKNKDIILLEFCLANPFKFKKDEIKIASEFKKGIRDIFIVAKFEREYTVLINNNKTYMIKGINDNLDNIISFKDLPLPIITTIIPFKNMIIYDGLFAPFNVDMGPSFNKVIENQYITQEKIYQL